MYLRISMKFDLMFLELLCRVLCCFCRRRSPYAPLILRGQETPTHTPLYIYIYIPSYYCSSKVRVQSPPLFVCIWHFYDVVTHYVCIKKMIKKRTNDTTPTYYYYKHTPTEMTILSCEGKSYTKLMRIRCPILSVDFGWNEQVGNGRKVLRVSYWQES